MVRHSRQTLDALSPAPRATEPPRATNTTNTLSELLGATPRFGFYAAMRKLECFYRDFPRWGEAVDPAHEPLRLGQDPSLAFRAAAFSSVFDGDSRRPPRLAATFFGAFGPNGPLPTHLTQYAADRRRHANDSALSGFLDIFHHRLLSLFYRAWADSQPTVCHDRPLSDRFSRYLGALLGLSTTPRARPADALDDVARFTAVHFACRTRHAEGLAKVLRICFGVEVRIDEFVGQALRIPDEYCWRIPSEPLGGPNPIGVLGESSRVGTEVWDHQSKFRVVIGPLTGATYERFLPGGAHLAKLIELVTRYAGPELAWDIRIVLREPDRRATVLGVTGSIGRTTHLGGGAGAFEDLVLDPSQHAA